MISQVQGGGERVFLCHSSADKEAVRKFYQRLRRDGFKPWLDEEDILPGQDVAVGDIQGCPVERSGAGVSFAKLCQQGRYVRAAPVCHDRRRRQGWPESSTSPENCT